MLTVAAPSTLISVSVVGFSAPRVCEEVLKFLQFATLLTLLSLPCYLGEEHVAEQKSLLASSAPRPMRRRVWVPTKTIFCILKIGNLVRGLVIRVYWYHIVDKKEEPVSPSVTESFHVHPWQSPVVRHRQY